MTTGDRIKHKRIEQGLSQEELGERVGVKKAAIHKYETGLVVNLKSSILEKLASVLDTTPAWLMGWEDMSKSELVDEIETTLATLPADTQREILRYIQMKKELEDEKKK